MGTDQMANRPTLTTTVDPDLFAAAKARAAAERRPLSGVVDDLLRAGLKALGNPLAGVGRAVHGRKIMARGAR